MTNKLIEAAKAAGGTTYTNRHYPGETACAFGPEALARFYAIARAEALEDAAKVCDRGAEMMLHGYKREGAARCAESIRALKEQDAAIAAGKGEVNG